MARLGLVDQIEIARWADSREAQGYLPRLIRRLILETGRGVVQLGFPGGEGVASGSWDGTVRATEATAFIPAGLSLWELSVEKDANRKAERDYAKRLVTPDDSPTEDCTYVSVSLRRWAKRLEWAGQKSQEGRWKDVRACGIDDIETWLESAPITHAWLSELLGFHPHGLVSAETWWTSWSGSTVVSFPAAAVLSGRKGEVDKLWTRLDGPGRITTVQGACYEDIFAFVSALALEDAEKGGSLLSRMALIDKVEAWRRLREYAGTLVLVLRNQEVTSDLGTGSAHHLIVPIVGGGTADITLEPIDSQEASKALAAVGLNERQAEEAGKLARLSLLAARRRIAQKPELHRPSWATAPIPRLQRRTLLLGRWDERSTEDLSIVCQLLGMEYESISEEITALMLAQDPMFARFGSAMGLVSHFDAWLLVKDSLRKEDLEVFQSAAFTVFGELNPMIDLPPDERYMASLRGKVRAHSGELRVGMATTLALLGSHGDMVIAGSALTGHEWASWTLRGILESANQDDTCRLWISLRDVLTLFAEAAPAKFLEAVRDGLRGESPLLRRMFTDGGGSNILFTDYPHSSLLWAIEVCAWSPSEFGQAVDLLARLAEIDPGGRLGKRPIGCLSAIFRPWYPQNSVSGEKRVAALDGLRSRHGSVAWSLMISMLPEVGGFATNISEPRFRGWKPPEIGATEEEYWRQVEEVSLRLLEDAATDPARWMSLLARVPSLPPYLRSRVLESLRSLASGDSLDSQARDQIWESLRVLALQYREFNEAPSDVPSAEIAQLGDIAELFQPVTSSKQLAWLFNEYVPSIPDVDSGSGEYDSMLALLRAQAAAKVANSMTWPEIQRFAVGVKLHWSVGVGLAQADITAYDPEMLALLEADGSADLELAHGYLSKRFQSEGWPWIDLHMHEGNLSPEQSGRLLLLTRDFPKAWEVAELAHEGVAAVFWRNFPLFGLGPDFPYVEAAAQRILGVGRPAGALHLLVLYRRQGRENERADLMAICLEELLHRIPENSEASALSRHDLIEAFSCLERSSISIDRLARLEWEYLEVFDHRSSPRTLSRYLTESPGFFVEIISRIYRPRLQQGHEYEKSQGEPEVSTDEAREAVAMNAYKLLSGWRIIPGTREDRTIDGESLKRWVYEARQLLDATHRLEVGDIHIGDVLASSPAAPDGVWPCVEVRDLLEALQSTKVEDGLRLRLHKNRGVTTRGMLDGGDQELGLATKYRGQSRQLADQWPRTAAVLRGLAEGYEREARHHEEAAERRRKGFET